MTETRTPIFTLPQYSDEVTDGPSMADWNEMVTNLDGLAATRAALGNRNILRNPSFEVWQRGTGSFVANNANVFTADGWLASSATSGRTATVTRSTLTLGAVPTGRYGLQVVTAAHSGAGDYAYMQQSVENVFTLAGQVVTVSFWAKAASGTPKVGIELSQYFGFGGSPSAEVSTPLGAVTLSTTLTRYSVTGTLPSLSGKTLGTDGEHALRLNLWVSAGSGSATRSSTTGVQNATFTFTQVQLESGNALSPFEYRSPSIELARCQRYFVRRAGTATASLPAFGAGVVVTTTQMQIPVIFPVPMRVPPTLTTSTLANLSVQAGNGSTAPTAVSFSGAVDAYSGIVFVTVGTSMTVGYAGFLWVLTASDFVDLSAEFN